MFRLYIRKLKKTEYFKIKNFLGNGDLKSKVQELLVQK